MEAVSEKDRLDFIRRQERIKGSGLFEKVGGSSATDSVGLEKILRLIRDVSGSPKELAVAGHKVIIHPPKWKHVSRLLVSVFEAVNSGASVPVAKIADDLQDAMVELLSSPSFPEWSLREKRAWFDDLDPDGFVPLLLGMNDVFNVAKLVEGLGVQVSSGK
jgi:hypothetical protein